MDAVPRLSRIAALSLFTACATHTPPPAPPPPAVVDAGPADAGPPPEPDAGPLVLALPEPLFRNMPLVGQPAEQVPTATTDTVTVAGCMHSAAAHCDLLTAKKGASAAQEASDLVRGEWSRQLFLRESEAYKQGWREVSHGYESANPKVTLWRAGTPFQSATLVVKSGALSVLPHVNMAPGFGDATYHFEDLPAPALAGEDFPLCLTPPAGAKVEHSGQTWSQACPLPAGQTEPSWQLPRVYGWSLVKGPSKDHVATFQKGDRFAEVSAGGKWKVTLLDKAKLAAAQKAYPALDAGTQAHLVTGTGLIVGGKYVPGPFLLTLKDGQIKANDVVLRAANAMDPFPAEVLFDRMAGPGFWPTLRLVGDDGVMSNLVSKDHDPDKLAAQLTKLLAAPGTDDEKVKRLGGFPGLHDVSEQTLRTIAQHWAAK